MAVAVRIGDANSPIVECMSLPSSLFPSPTSATPTATPTVQEEDSGDPQSLYQCINEYNMMLTCCR